MPLIKEHGPADLAAALSIQTGQVAKQERDQESNRRDLLALSAMKRTNLAERELELGEARHRFDQKVWSDKLRQISRQSDQQRQTRMDATEGFQNALAYAEQAGLFGEEGDEDGMAAFELFQAQGEMDPDGATDKLWEFIDGAHKKQEADALRQASGEALTTLFEPWVQSTRLTASQVMSASARVMAGMPIDKAVSMLKGLADGETDKDDDPIRMAIQRRVESAQYAYENTQDPDYAKMSDEAKHAADTAMAVAVAQAQTDAENYDLTGKPPQWIVDKLAPPKRKPGVNGGQTELMRRSAFMEAKARAGKNATQEQVEAEFAIVWKELMAANGSK